LSASTPSLEHKAEITAIDGLQPDMGHEVLWVIRECQSGELLLARTLSAVIKIWQNCSNRSSKCSVTNCWGNSDGQQSIRQAVKTALPEVARFVFHYCAKQQKEFEADRHAKKN